MQTNQSEQGIVLPITEGKIVPTEGKKETMKITKADKKAELKKRLFIKEYLKCKNATKAYMKIFKVTYDSANALGSKMLASISMSELLEAGKVTDAHLIKKIEEGLEADRPYGKDGLIHEDYATRHSYITTALKLKGRLKEESTQAPLMQGLQIVINK